MGSGDARRSDVPVLHESGIGAGSKRAPDRGGQIRADANTVESPSSRRGCRRPCSSGTDRRVTVCACDRRAVCGVRTTPFNRSSLHQRAARRHCTAHGCTARNGQLHPMDSCRRRATAARRHRAASHRLPRSPRPQKRFGSTRRGRRRRARTGPRPDGSASAGDCVQLDGTTSCGNAADRHRVSTPARTAADRTRRSNSSSPAPTNSPLCRITGSCSCC